VCRPPRAAISAHITGFRPLHRESVLDNPLALSRTTQSNPSRSSNSSLRHLHTSPPKRHARYARDPPPPAAPSKPNLVPVVDPDAPTPPVPERSQSAADWRIIKRLAVNIWPRDSISTRVRVLGALSLLVAGKVLNVQVPFFFKDIVDSLNVEITADTGVWILAGASVAGCECLLCGRAKD
jgi:ATP-binding cassette subfamily B (MDR/TAP) protein 7